MIANWGIAGELVDGRVVSRSEDIEKATAKCG
jgi:hypothetical protein